MPENDDKLIQILSDIKPPYVWLPYIILDLYGPAMGQAGWLYTMLNRFKNSGTSEAKVGERTLADACGIDRETVSRYAKTLEDLGTIKVIPGDRINPTTYRILLPAIPPTPEMIAEHWPKGWTPPARAQKMLRNIREYLSSGEGPQETGGAKGGGGTIPPPHPEKPKDPKEGGGTTQPPTGKGVEASSPQGGGITPPGWGGDAPRVGAPSSQYKYFKYLKTNNNPVVESLFNDLLKNLKSFDGTIDETDVDGFLCDALTINNDPDWVKEYLGEKVRVAHEQRDKITEFRSWFRTAIKQDYHGRAFYQAKRKEQEAAAQKQKEAAKEKERLEYEAQFQRDLEKKKAATVDEIVKELQDCPGWLELDRHIRMTKTKYEGVNPNWEKALEIFGKGR